jgi:hypothetical protein
VPAGGRDIVIDASRATFSASLRAISQTIARAGGQFGLIVSGFDRAP